MSKRRRKRKNKGAPKASARPKAAKKARVAATNDSDAEKTDGEEREGEPDEEEEETDDAVSSGGRDNNKKRAALSNSKSSSADRKKTTDGSGQTSEEEEEDADDETDVEGEEKEEKVARLSLSDSRATGTGMPASPASASSSSASVGAQATSKLDAHKTLVDWRQLLRAIFAHFKPENTIFVSQLIAAWIGVAFEERRIDLIELFMHDIGPNTRKPMLGACKCFYDRHLLIRNIRDCIAWLHSQSNGVDDNSVLAGNLEAFLGNTVRSSVPVPAPSLASIVPLAAAGTAVTARAIHGDSTGNENKSRNTTVTPSMIPVATEAAATRPSETHLAMVHPLPSSAVGSSSGALDIADNNNNNGSVAAVITASLSSGDVAASDSSSVVSIAETTTVENQQQQPEHQRVDLSDDDSQMLAQEVEMAMSSFTNERGSVLSTNVVTVDSGPEPPTAEQPSLALPSTRQQKDGEIPAQKQQQQQQQARSPIAAPLPEETSQSLLPLITQSQLPPPPPPPPPQLPSSVPSLPWSVLPAPMIVGADLGASVVTAVDLVTPPLPPSPIIPTTTATMTPLPTLASVIIMPPPLAKQASPSMSRKPMLLAPRAGSRSRSRSPSPAQSRSSSSFTLHTLTATSPSSSGEERGIGDDNKKVRHASRSPSPRPPPAASTIASTTTAGGSGDEKDTSSDQRLQEAAAKVGADIATTTAVTTTVTTTIAGAAATITLDAEKKNKTATSPADVSKSSVASLTSLPPASVSSSATTSAAVEKAAGRTADDEKRGTKRGRADKEDDGPHVTAGNGSGIAGRAASGALIVDSSLRTAVNQHVQPPPSLFGSSSSPPSSSSPTEPMMLSYQEGVNDTTTTRAHSPVSTGPPLLPSSNGSSKRHAEPRKPRHTAASASLTPTAASPPQPPPPSPKSLSGHTSKRRKRETGAEILQRNMPALMLQLNGLQSQLQRMEDIKNMEGKDAKDVKAIVEHLIGTIKTLKLSVTNQHSDLLAAARSRQEHDAQRMTGIRSASIGAAVAQFKDMSERISALVADDQKREREAVQRHREAVKQRSNAALQRRVEAARRHKEETVQRRARHDKRVEDALRASRNGIDAWAVGEHKRVSQELEVALVECDEERSTNFAVAKQFWTTAVAATGEAEKAASALLNAQKQHAYAHLDTLAQVATSIVKEAEEKAKATRASLRAEVDHKAQTVDEYKTYVANVVKDMAAKFDIPISSSAPTALPDHSAPSLPSLPSSSSSSASSSVASSIATAASVDTSWSGVDAKIEESRLKAHKAFGELDAEMQRTWEQTAADWLARYEVQLGAFADVKKKEHTERAEKSRLDINVKKAELLQSLDELATVVGGDDVGGDLSTNIQQEEDDNRRVEEDAEKEEEKEAKKRQQQLQEQLDATLRDPSVEVRVKDAISSFVQTKEAGATVHGDHDRNQQEIKDHATEVLADIDSSIKTLEKLLVDLDEREKRLLDFLSSKSSDAQSGNDNIVVA